MGSEMCIRDSVCICPARALLLEVQVVPLFLPSMSASYSSRPDRHLLLAAEVVCFFLPSRSALSFLPPRSSPLVLPLRPCPYFCRPARSSPHFSCPCRPFHPCRPGDPLRFVIRSGRPLALEVQFWRCLSLDMVVQVVAPLLPTWRTS